MKCTVCEIHSANGNHYGVLCCRACSAFFRRHADSKYVKLRCQSVQCDKRLYFCKPCRLRKCYSVGMNTKNFQYNRDPIQTVAVPQSLANFVGRSNHVLFCSPDDTSKMTFVDLSNLIQKASNILEFGPETPKMFSVGRSQLEKLNCGLDFMNLKFDKGILEKISEKEMSIFWEYYVLRTAKWLTYFDEFQLLPHEIKLQLLLSFWHVFGRFDKLFATSQFRNQKGFDEENTKIVSNGMGMQVGKTQVDFSLISSYPLHQIFYFLSSIGTWDLAPCISKMAQLKLSNIEVNYMLAQLTFSYAGKRFQGEIMGICERFQDILSNDLHNHYVNDLKMSNYSTRLTKMMEINNLIQKDIWLNRPRAVLASTFKVFSVEFSHPDMFVDTGFVENKTFH